MKTLCTLLYFFFSVQFFAQVKEVDSNSVKETIEKGKDSRATNLDRSITFFEKALNQSKSIDYTKGEYSAQLELGITAHYQGNYPDAIEYYKRALKVAKIMGFDEGIGRSYLNIAVALTLKGDYYKSTREYLNALPYALKTSDTLVTITSYQNLALIYLDLEQFKQAEIYNKKAIELSKRLNDSLRIGSNAINLIELYLETGQYDKVHEELVNLGPLIDQFKNERLAAFYNLKSAEYQFSKEDFEIALKFAKKADIDSGMLPPNDLAYVKWVLGNINYKLENFRTAEKHYLASFQLAKSLESLPLLLNANAGLAEVSAVQNRFKDAYKFAMAYNMLNDSIRGEKNSKLISELTAKYESELKEKEIAEQKLTIEQRELELQKKKSQNTLMTGLAIFLSLLSVLSWFLFRQRQKRKNQELVAIRREQQVKTLESLMEGEEKERLRIAKELHDGVNVDLSAIKFKLTSLLEKNNAVINEAVAMIDRSCEQVRAISHNLVPPALKDFSLVEALQDYCTTTNALHTPEISFQHMGEAIDISKKAEVNIFRIVQELVNNGIKHAEASEIDVQISHREQIIQVTVEDNGKGFDKDAIGGNGIGLGNIQSRIDYLNAQLDFHSGAQGTSYVIDIDTTRLT